MTQINRLRNTQISNGNLINADDIATELNQLVNESNTQDTRITSVESGNLSISGNKTFSGTVTLSGTTTITGGLSLATPTDPVSPVEGQIWENSTTHLAKFYNGTSVLTLATLTDLLVSVPSVTGQSGKFLTNNGTITSWGTTVLQLSYDSGNQTITAAGALTLAHSLGAKPKVIMVYLVNTTAEHGYTIGDETLTKASNDTTNRGCSIVADATNINVRFGSDANTFFVTNKGTGVQGQITNASWKLLLRAYT